MKRALFILAGIISLFAFALATLAYFRVRKVESERNVLRTDKARKARWPAENHKEPEPQPESPPQPTTQQ